MVDLELFNIILPPSISALIAFIILGLQRFARTSDDTTTHTIKVQNIEVKVTGFEKKFDAIDQEHNNIWRKIDELNSKVTLNSYRIDRLEQDRNGKKTPV